MFPCLYVSVCFSQIDETEMLYCRLHEFCCKAVVVIICFASS